MKIFSHYGCNDFVVCLGYKGYVVKEYFANYFLHMANVTFDLARNSMHVHQMTAEPWRVTLVDTGEHTMTGGRLNASASTSMTRASSSHSAMASPTFASTSCSSSIARAVSL